MASPPGEADHPAELAKMLARYDIDSATAEILNCFIELVRTAPELPEKWHRTATILAADSLSAFEFGALRTATSMADVGTGAGFPGMVLAIVRRDLQMALIDPNGDRCQFMRRAAAVLGLNCVEVVHRRAGEWRAGDGTRDLVISRNTIRVPELMACAIPLMRPVGSLVVWRGSHEPWGEKAAVRLAAKHGMGFVRSVELPWIRANRRLLHFELLPA